MDRQEIQDQLRDNQEATLRIDDRVTRLESKERIDYTIQFDELKKLIRAQAERDDTLSIREKVKDQTQAMNSLVAAISKSIQSQDYLVRNFPKELKMKVLHRFEDKTKGLIIGGTALLIITAITTGLSFHLRSENKRLKENDVKFRMIRQTYPKAAYWTDTAYSRNPEATEAKTKQLEAEQLAIAQAEAAAKQKKEEAVKAEKEVDHLKKKRKMQQ